MPVYESVPIGWDLCARCGVQYPEWKLRREWSGMNVCHGPSTNECWSPRHPQEYVQAVKDTQGVKPNMRPEPEAMFIYAFLYREDGTTYIRETTPYPIIRE